MCYGKLKKGVLVYLTGCHWCCAASVVGIPKNPLHLATSYRTHAGILNVAAAVVDVVREYYPMVSTAAAVLLAIGIPAIMNCASQ